MSSGVMYQSLSELWYLRDSFGSEQRTLSQFANFLLRDKKAPQIVLMLFAAWRAAMASAPVVKQEDKVPTPVIFGHTVMPKVTFFLDALKNTENSDRHKLMQIFLPCVLFWWFGPRQANMEIIRVISKEEWDRRQSLINYPSLLLGIHIVVHPSGFQIIKHETKTKESGVNFDFYGDEIYKRFAHSKMLLPMIVEAYNHLTRNNIPHEPESRWYSLYAPLEKDYLCIQYHNFPLVCPSFPMGNRAYLRPDIKLQGTVQVSGVNFIQGSKFTSFKCWKGAHLVFLKNLKVPCTVNGKPIVCGLRPTFNPNSARAEDCVQKTKPSRSVRVSLHILDQIFSDSVSAGALVLKSLYFHKEGNVKVFHSNKSIPMGIDQSLRLYDHPFVASYLGRCVRATAHFAVADYLKDVKCLSSVLQSKEDQILREEAHLTRNIVKQHYNVYLKIDLLEFSKLSSKVFQHLLASRLASHPDAPGQPFKTFVEEEKSDMHISVRCRDMKFLSIKGGEQTAAITLVSQFYEALYFMRAMSKEIGGLPLAFHVRLKELEAILTEAKEIWSAKQPSMVCKLVRTASDLAKRAGAALSSPSKRHKPE